ncbi:MAG: hypothetical protein WCC72_09440 [Dehalococcoidales bacterium]|jgi:hypothetical protein
MLTKAIYDRDEGEKQIILPRWEMRCLCYAKFLPGGAITPGEFFAHIGSKWSCIEDSSRKIQTDTVNEGIQNRLMPHAIVFITECKSIKQLTADLATMPGAGISGLEIFTVKEVLEYQ